MHFSPSHRQANPHTVNLECEIDCFNGFLAEIKWRSTSPRYFLVFFWFFSWHCRKFRKRFVSFTTWRRLLPGTRFFSNETRILFIYWGESKRGIFVLHCQPGNTSECPHHTTGLTRRRPSAASSLSPIFHAAFLIDRARNTHTHTQRPSYKKKEKTGMTWDANASSSLPRSRGKPTLWSVLTFSLSFRKGIGNFRNVRRLDEAFCSPGGAFPILCVARRKIPTLEICMLHESASPPFSCLFPHRRPLSIRRRRPKRWQKDI